MIANPTSLPVIVLVETQMGENIGAAARAMANFGLKELRLIKPRDGWPNEKARAAASRGDTIIDAVILYDTLEDALKDLNLVFATTARQHDLAKAVVSPNRAATLMGDAIRHGDRCGVVFGRERWGLTSDEVALCDQVLTIPVDEAFASLNIAQAVILVAYEWRQHLLANPDWTPFPEKERSPQATKDELFHLFGHLETALDAVEFFRPDHKRPHMVRNLRSIFQKARLNEQEIRTLRGAIAALEHRPARVTPRSMRKSAEVDAVDAAGQPEIAADGSADIEKS
ncbi:MAG: RNA methyltransferase [Ancalomicrobiaceae bacterium]|nr:RNA methyltransferase [Ancalomicrobiaceae bacterium]